jgi:hypothetical protein
VQCCACTVELHGNPVSYGCSLNSGILCTDNRVDTMLYITLVRAPWSALPSCILIKRLYQQSSKILLPIR